MVSPKTGSRTGRRVQDQVDVWTGLQITRNGRNVYKFVEDARWQSWGIVKHELTDVLVPSVADIRGNDCSLWVLGIG